MSASEFWNISSSNKIFRVMDIQCFVRLINQGFLIIIFQIITWPLISAGRFILKPIQSSDCKIEPDKKIIFEMYYRQWRNKPRFLANTFRTPPVNTCAMQGWFYLFCLNTSVYRTSQTSPSPFFLNRAVVPRLQSTPLLKYKWHIFIQQFHDPSSSFSPWRWQHQC